MSKLTLCDTGGNPLARFGAAGIRRVLMSPVNVTSAKQRYDYACVSCESAETFLTRDGVGARSYTLSLTYWTDAMSDTPVEEEYTAQERDKAISRFIELCKRKPLYEPIPNPRT
jgi:hypothetical protein